MTSVAVAISPTGGTGFGSSGASSVFSMIVTGASPLLVTLHDTVVWPVAGSHSAFAAYTTEAAAGSGTSVVVASVVGTAAVVVGASSSALSLSAAPGRRRRVVRRPVGCTGVGASVGGAGVVGGVAALDGVVATASPTHRRGDQRETGHEQEAAAALGHVVPLRLKASRSTARTRRQ